MGEQSGLAVWTEDEAGPYRTQPYQGKDWHPQGAPLKQPHEYFPNGTAKIITLFHPDDGSVRVRGVESTPNQVLHPWLEENLAEIIEALPPLPNTDSAENVGATAPSENRSIWESWRQDLTVKFTLPESLPPLRLLLVCDNLAGHKTHAFVLWLCEHGILPLYTPLGGSWLNMAESIQKILKRRALDGLHPAHPQQIINNFEAVAKAWNRQPTPFEWGGKRTQRRRRAHLRKRYRLAASGAFTRHPIRQPLSLLEKCLCA